jgi:hypothetical protein
MWNFIYRGLPSFSLVYFLFHSLITFCDFERFNILRKLKEIKIEKLRCVVLFSFENVNKHLDFVSIW